jgi:hypothetical protein
MMLAHCCGVLQEASASPSAVRVSEKNPSNENTVFGPTTLSSLILNFSWSLFRKEVFPLRCAPIKIPPFYEPLIIRANSLSLPKKLSPALPLVL